MRRIQLSDKIYIIPQRDVVVKQDGQKLAPGGEWVEPSTYWRRRLADRAIVISRGPEQSGPKKPETKAADLGAPECSDEPVTVTEPETKPKKRKKKPAKLED